MQEQLSIFGRNYIKGNCGPQIRLLVFDLAEFDSLVVKCTTGEGKSPIKGSKRFPYVKFSSPSMGKVSTEVDNKAVLVYARLIEALFIARLLIIEIQYDVLNDDSVNHEEQVD